MVETYLQRLYPVWSGGLERLGMSLGRVLVPVQDLAW
jgi:hypothetical protein